MKESRERCEVMQADYVKLRDIYVDIIKHHESVLHNLQLMDAKAAAAASAESSSLAMSEERQLITSSLRQLNEALRFENRSLKNEHWLRKYENLAIERDRMRQHRALLSGTRGTRSIVPPKSHVSASTTFQPPADQGMALAIAIELPLQRLKNNCVKTRLKYNETCQLIAKSIQGFAHFLLLFRGSFHSAIGLLADDIKETRSAIKCDLNVMGNVIQNTMVTLAKFNSEQKERSFISEMRKIKGSAIVTRVVDSDAHSDELLDSHRHLHALSELELRAMEIGSIMNEQREKKEIAKRESIDTLVKDFITLGGLRKVPAMSSELVYEPLYTRKNRFRFGTKYIDIMSRNHGLFVKLSHNRSVPLQEYVDKHAAFELKKLISRRTVLRH